MGEQEQFVLAGAEPVAVPLELRVLRDCVSASAELERLLGTPVIAETVTSAESTEGGPGRWAALLSIAAGEPIFSRTVRLVPLHGRSAGAVAESSLWLAVHRVPDRVVRFLTGTPLTLGQVLRLVGVRTVTRRDAWQVGVAGRREVVAFGCRDGTPVLVRRMLVLVDDVPVAVTEESFCAARRGVRRVASRRSRPGTGLVADRR